MVPKESRVGNDKKYVGSKWIWIEGQRINRGNTGNQVYFIVQDF